MKDCFALLDEPRRPWLEGERLRQKFLRLSADQHPDRVAQFDEGARSAAQEKFTALNAAYNRLRDPKERLLHFLELELGAAPPQVQEVPIHLMEAAMEVGRVCREADALVSERAKAGSPLLQVPFLGPAQELVGRVGAVQEKIRGWREELDRELVRLDAQWCQAESPEARRRLLVELLSVYRRLSYYARWAAQLQERVVQLSF